MPRSTRRGFTLIELLIVIAIISILMGLLIPIVATLREGARKAQVGNNLKRILEAQIDYAEDEGTYAFPSGITPPSAVGSENNLYVGKVFQILARENELSVPLFTNPGAIVKPPQKAYLSYDDILANADGNAFRWSYSFAWDYTAPPNSSAAGRPIVSDRDPSWWGGKGAMVCYGDGHVTWLLAQNDIGHTIDGDASGVPVEFAVISEGFGVEDDIYRFQPSIGENSLFQFELVRGSATMAWLR